MWHIIKQTISRIFNIIVHTQHSVISFFALMLTLHTQGCDTCVSGQQIITDNLVFDGKFHHLHKYSVHVM